MNNVSIVKLVEKRRFVVVEKIGGGKKWSRERMIKGKKF